MYHRELIRSIEDGILFINSAQLGKALGIPSTQVRKDLSYLAEQGRPGVGYNTATLAKNLETFLGLPKHKKTALVGIGNLANALLHFPGFSQYGIEISYLFDNDPAKIGTSLAGLEIQHLDQISPFLKDKNISIGIITTPANAAEAVATKMIGCGIRSIWNFAPITLHGTEDVFILNQDLTVEMALLSYSVIEHLSGKANNQTNQQ